MCVCVCVFILLKFVWCRLSDYGSGQLYSSFASYLSFVPRSVAEMSLTMSHYWHDPGLWHSDSFFITHNTYPCLVSGHERNIKTITLWFIALSHHLVTWRVLHKWLVSYTTSAVSSREQCSSHSMVARDGMPADTDTRWLVSAGGANARCRFYVGGVDGGTDVPVVPCQLLTAWSGWGPRVVGGGRGGSSL